MKSFFFQTSEKLSPLLVSLLGGLIGFIFHAAPALSFSALSIGMAYFSFLPLLIVGFGYGLKPFLQASSFFLALTLMTSGIEASFFTFSIHLLPLFIVTSLAHKTVLSFAPLSSLPIRIWGPGYWISWLIILVMFFFVLVSWGVHITNGPPLIAIKEGWHHLQESE